MHSVKTKHSKEIDILAIHPLEHKRIHIEVKVAINPTRSLRAWSPAKYGNEDLPGLLLLSFSLQSDAPP